MKTYMENFIEYWRNIDTILKEKNLNPETTAGGHRIHRFIECLDRDDRYPCFSKDLVKFRIKDIHDDAVYYAKLYDVIEEYPFSDEECKSFINQLVEEKGTENR